MLNYYKSNNKNFPKKLKLILGRRRLTQISKVNIVRKILRNVKREGDKAIINYEKKFSKNKLVSNRIIFSKKEVNKITLKLDKKLKRSIDLAFKRIKKFHSKQKHFPYKYKDSYKNELSYNYLPLDKVGVYVPGGTASYPSTVLMNCIPAVVAGVKNIYMTTPSFGSEVNPAVIYAAKKCGVKKIYKTGGAQSIAAFAYGSKSFEQVDKIVGPGNTYVAIAKKEVFGEVGIDMVAGPSEVTIVGDKYSNPEWIASDLIAQAEHDTFAQSILISKDRLLIKNVIASLKKQIKILPKKKIAKKSLKKFGLAIHVNNDSEISRIINIIAPEHLELNVKNYKNLIPKIKNAGSIFVGKFSPEAMGDYIAGPNHVLPTSGAAKFSSGLSVGDFLKRHSFIKITKTGIERLGPSVINLAKHENLEGHANSVEIRIKKDS